MNLEHAVKRGIEKFDLEDPGWENYIDRDKLDMQSPLDCMLGQRFGSFSEGLKILGIELGQSYGLALPRSIRTAFEARQAWRELRRLWIEEIEVRLAGVDFDAELEDVTSGRALVVV